MRSTIELVALLLLFALVGAAIGYALGYLIVPVRFDLGGPIFGNREVYGPVVGRCCSVPAALASFVIGIIWLTRDDGESEPKQGQ